jgi:hypothetical protein
VQPSATFSVVGVGARLCGENFETVLSGVDSKRETEIVFRDEAGNELAWTFARGARFFALSFDPPCVELRTRDAAGRRSPSTTLCGEQIARTVTARVADARVAGDSGSTAASNDASVARDARAPSTAHDASVVGSGAAPADVPEPSQDGCSPTRRPDTLTSLVLLALLGRRRKRPLPVLLACLFAAMRNGHHSDSQLQSYTSQRTERATGDRAQDAVGTALECAAGTALNTPGCGPNSMWEKGCYASCSAVGDDAGCARRLHLSGDLDQSLRSQTRRHVKL